MSTKNKPPTREIKMERVNALESVTQTNPYTEMLAAAQGGTSLQGVGVLTEKLRLQAIQQSVTDLLEWKRGVDSARNPDRPQRLTLIKVYQSVVSDPHLSAVMELGKQFVLGKDFQIIDAEGKEDKEATELLQRTWFYDFLNMVLDAEFYGHSLIEFGELIEGEFTTVELVARHHVNPKIGHVLSNPSDATGTDYRVPPLSDWCLEAGVTGDLGILWKAAPLVILKKLMSGAWLQFGQLFGVPLRVVKTTSKSKTELEQIDNMLEQVGIAGWARFPKDTEIDFVEASNTDSYKIFQEYIARADGDISKLIIGTTMVTDDGSSLSQAQVHERTTASMTLARTRKLEFYMNSKALPYFASKGYPFADRKFKFIDGEKLSLGQLWPIVQGMIAEYDIDPNWVTEKFGIPILGLKSKQSNPAPQDNTPPTDNPKGGDAPPPPAPTTPNAQGPMMTDIQAFYDSALVGGHHPNCVHGMQAALPPTVEQQLVDRALSYARELHKGSWPEDSIPPDLLLDTYNVLADGVQAGMGEIAFNAGDASPELLCAMRANIATFSAAKSFAQMQAMKAELVNSDGTVRSFAQFKAAITPIAQSFNANWLRTEYNQAVISGLAGAQWQQLKANEDIYPNLRYETVGDDRVRAAHQALDGKIRPLSDSFWNEYYPPLGWGCRCDVVPEGPEANLTSTTELNKAKQNAAVSEGFKGNVGKDGLVFEDGHAYYRAQGAQREISAVDNLRMLPAAKLYKPARVERMPSLAQNKHSEGQFEGWWMNESENSHQLPKDTFIKRDVEGVNILFTPELKRKTLQDKPNEARWSFANRLPDVLKDPDELYVNRYPRAEGNPITRTYVKYYQEEIIVAQVETPPGEAPYIKTFFTSNPNDARTDNKRRGILIRRK